MDKIEPTRAPLQVPRPGPLSGLTILLVEDSNFAADAFRLMCLHSGTRLRRVDSIASARRHLQLYRPDFVIVDLGLPDGSGTEFIAELTRLWNIQSRPIILGLSGDPDSARHAKAAGAAGFIAKPLGTLAEFQTLILSFLKNPLRSTCTTSTGTRIMPDPLAYYEDLQHAVNWLNQTETQAYARQFLGSLAHCTGDTALETAIRALPVLHSGPETNTKPHEHLNQILSDRLSPPGPI